MNKSDDLDAPKNQMLDHAPHHGRNADGDIVADSIESAGQQSAWDTSGPLDPADSQTENAGGAGTDGYGSGPGDYAALHLEPEGGDAGPRGK